MKKEKKRKKTRCFTFFARLPSVERFYNVLTECVKKSFVSSLTFFPFFNSSSSSFSEAIKLETEICRFVVCFANPICLRETEKERNAIKSQAQMK